MKVKVCRNTTGTYSVWPGNAEVVMSIIGGFGIWTAPDCRPIIEVIQPEDAELVLGLRKPIAAGSAGVGTWEPPLGPLSALKEEIEEPEEVTPAPVKNVAKKDPVKKAPAKKAKKKVSKKAK